MARHRKSPRSQRNLTVIDPLTLPKAPGGGGGTQKVVPVHVPFMWVTHTQNLVEFRKNKFFTPNPPRYPKSHPWAWPRRPNENPVWYVIYISFVRRYTKFGFKTFEIDFVIQI